MEPAVISLSYFALYHTACTPPSAGWLQSGQLTAERTLTMGAGHCGKWCFFCWTVVLLPSPGTATPQSQLVPWLAQPDLKTEKKKKKSSDLNKWKVKSYTYHRFFQWGAGVTMENLCCHFPKTEIHKMLKWKKVKMQLRLFFVNVYEPNLCVIA